jgi:threonine aldolase
MSDRNMCNVVDAVVQKYIERAIVGQRKYGVTIDRTDLLGIQWLCHLQEELMDATVYIEKLLITQSNKPTDL